ncbi:hypothetical protein LMJF_09_1360 [Leishmania major strain Friedlin]|uniref:Uncharacterized protein n=1 Tax=Leishmania major TaxID=5664 RepID=Q4QHN9_LEIMA|nr:hypothetical protein LMJF_09_1360 [Leishmania major strain Friedlin]CAG9569753.1 hypothetical_protein_-__conserved [Leishmania major strain Friedlin]CAJ03037.1 hypothetical protein LMJF_09_1360 [Leishmania major strain Friedlin]|eukprot:XP_001681309.1 hypothetical protein LMJF_09_1360 [Leishmania major strain Friedlin]
MPSWGAALAEPVSEPESGEGKRVRRKAGTASFSQQLKSLFRPPSSHSLEWEPRAPLLAVEASPGCSPALLLQSLAEVNGPTMLTGAAMPAHASLEATATTVQEQLPPSASHVPLPGVFTASHSPVMEPWKKSAESCPLYAIGSDSEAILRLHATAEGTTASASSTTRRSQWH